MRVARQPARVAHLLVPCPENTYSPHLAVEVPTQDNALQSTIPIQENMLEKPTGLLSAADMGKAMELLAALRPPHSAFSKYFPRVYGTPFKRPHEYVKGRRTKPKHDWSKTGCHAQAMLFLEFADNAIQAMAAADEKFKLTPVNLRPIVVGIFNRYTKKVRVFGAQKETMKRFVLIALGELRTEMEAAS